MKLTKMCWFAGLSVALTALIGCARNPAAPGNLNSDGLSGFVSSEMVGMVASTSELMDQGLFKSFADTTNIELVIDPWRLDTATNAFVREAEANYPRGKRTRRDTVWFKDGQGRFVTANLRSGLVDTIHHVRKVTGARDENQVVFNLDMTGVITRTATDTTLVRNGEVKGSYNGVALDRGRKVTDLTYRRTGGRWGRYPVSGSIDIERILVTIKIVFGGDHSATATITRRRDGETKTITIDLDNGEEAD